jgi:hypothetical protein
MRQQTLQEQYNLIVEGKGSTHAFHKQALKQFPHLFTAQSSFDQVITVLKQKSIISEMVAQGLVSNSSGPNFFEIFNTNMAKLNEEAKAESKKADEEVVKAEKKTAKDKSAKYLNNQNGSEFLLGFYVESKNIKYVDKTVDQIKDIVVKNLSKDPLYYVKSGQFGLEELGYKEDVPGLGPTKEVKGKYASSGMEPVKLNEVFYGSSDGDYDADQESRAKAEMYYDKGLEAYSEGNYLKADQYYKLALKNGSSLGWTEQDLPPYSDESLKELDVTGIAGSEDEEDYRKGASDFKVPNKIADADWNWAYNWVKAFALKWAEQQGINSVLALKQAFQKKGNDVIIKDIDKVATGAMTKFSDTPKAKRMFSLKEGLDIYTVSAAALVQALETNPNFISSIKREIAGDLAKRNTILKKIDDYAKNNPDIRDKAELTKKEILNAEPMREVKSKLVNEILKRIRTK